MGGLSLNCDVCSLPMAVEETRVRDEQPDSGKSADRIEHDVYLVVFTRDRSLRQSCDR